MDCNINLINISDTQHSFTSPTSTTPIRRPLMIKNGDKDKKVGLVDIVNALDILMIAIKEQFTNFREKLQRINISQIAITAAKKLRGICFQRFYLFFMRFIRRINIYEDNDRLSVWSDNMITETKNYQNEYVGETLNDMADILLNDQFTYDNSTVHKYQIHRLRFKESTLPDHENENIMKANNLDKDRCDLDDKYSLKSSETGKISQITETEAFKKINEMEAEISRLKEEMKKIMGLSTTQYNNKCEDSRKTSVIRPSSSIDDGISITSSQFSPIISPKVNDISTSFPPPPPPPPPLPSLLNKNNKTKDKSVIDESKCKKIEKNVPTTKENASNNTTAKLNSVILLNEIQNVKLKKVSMDEIKDRKNKKTLMSSECNDVGSFLQQALYEKFKNVKSEEPSDTDSDSDLSLWSDDEFDVVNELQENA